MTRSISLVALHLLWFCLCQATPVHGQMQNGPPSYSDEGLLNGLMHQPAHDEIRSSRTQAAGNGLRAAEMNHDGAAFASHTNVNEQYRSGVNEDRVLNAPKRIQPSYGESFISREREREPQPTTTSTNEMFTKIAVNLVIVLVLAAGAILFMKQIQKTKEQGRGLHSSERSQMTILDSISIGGNSKLYLLDIDASQVLVASDATGVKSVTVIKGDFEASLQEEQETLAASTLPMRRSKRQAAEETPEIDEQLARLFLRNSKKSA